MEDELARMAAEAGIEPPLDPIAATGDLKSDIDTFTSLDACVRAHVSRDTLFGDALDALGYDTFTRDACRTLQALKEHRVEPCKPIAFAALRMRCEVQVATLLGEAALCPSSSMGAANARDPICLARSLRDVRLCAAAPESDQNACRALVTGDPAGCAADRVCARQVTRWRAVLERPAPKPELATSASADITVDDHAKATVDLTKFAAMGAVIKPLGDTMQIIVGRPKSAAWARPEDSWATPQVFVVLTIPRVAVSARPAKLGKTPAPAGALQLGVGELTLDLLAPGVADLSGTMATARTLTVDQISTAMGAPVVFTLVVELTQAPHRYAVSLRVQTFVRDAPATTLP